MKHLVTIESILLVLVIATALVNYVSSSELSSEQEKEKAQKVFAEDGESNTYEIRKQKLFYQNMLRNLLIKLIKENNVKDSNENDYNRDELSLDLSPSSSSYSIINRMMKKSYFKPRVGRRNWLNDQDDYSDESQTNESQNELMKKKRTFLKPRVGK